MASDYGLNFGFRRSDESMAVREGRQKVPATGTYRCGECVVIDDATPGFLVKGGADEVAVTGYSGLLVQEEGWDFSIYEPGPVQDSFGRGMVRNNRMAIIWSGAGTKVWFKNTAAQTRADGRVVDAVDVVDFTGGISVGDLLGWDGAAWAVTATAAAQFMKVTATNGTDYLEAVLLK